MREKRLGRGRPPRSQAERFWPKVRMTHTCWIWTASLRGHGYGQFFIQDGKPAMPAHRWTYQQFIGPIPEGLVLDHLCRNRRCVNPWHLEPVTRSENNLRGEGSHAKNARKTHCVNGHEFTPENVFRKSNGGRGCRECGRIRWRAFRAKKLAEDPNWERNRH